MPAVALPRDNCLTAEDVRRRALDVQRRRMALRPQAINILVKPKIVEETVLKAQVFPSTKVFGKVIAHFPIYWLESSADPKAPKMRDILKMVARAADIPVGDVTGTRRSSHYVRARQIGMLLCSMRCKHASYPAIGRVFCKDHTTVLHAVEKLRPIRDLLNARVAADTPLPYLVAAAFDAYDETFMRK